MGSWGTAVDADDTFQDVIGLFDRNLKREQSIEAANEAVLAAYREELEDFDDEPAVLFALIDRQWTYGKVDPALLANIQVDGFGLANWQDEPKPVLKKRKADIDRFIRRVSTDNPKPKRIPKLTRRKPKFSPGDCLAFELDDGRVTGAYVLATNDSDPEHGRDLIVMLDYLGTDPPAIQLFKKRQWLRLHHGSWAVNWIARGMDPISSARSPSRFQLLEQCPFKTMTPRRSTVTRAGLGLDSKSCTWKDCRTTGHNRSVNGRARRSQF